MSSKKFRASNQNAFQSLKMKILSNRPIIKEKRNPVKKTSSKIWTINIVICRQNTIIWVRACPKICRKKFFLINFTEEISSRKNLEQKNRPQKCSTEEISSFDPNSIFAKKFDFGPKLRFSSTVSIFYKKIIFRP